MMMIAMMAISMTFVACKKDDKSSDNPGPGPDPDPDPNGYVIEAKDVQNSNSSISTVEAELLILEKTYTAVYSNNGFKLVLPTEIEGEPYIDFYPLFLSALNKDGDKIGDISCRGEKDNSLYFLDYTYAVNNVHYEDSYEDEEEWDGYTVVFITNCDYKKGWNMEYTQVTKNEEKKIMTFTTTMQKPADINFYWRFSSPDFPDFKSFGAGNIVKKIH
jgi:hypothetical protein